MGILKVKHIALGVAFAAGFSTPAMAQDTFEVVPGNWVSESVGGGTMQAGGQTIELPSQTVSDEACITPEDAVLSKDHLFGVEEGVDCKGTAFSVAGSTVTIGLTCNLAGSTVNGTTIMTFSEDRKSATGTSSMKGTGPGGQVFTITQTMTTTHAGECAAE